jgi:glucose/arabinose dehydrogenase
MTLDPRRLAHRLPSLFLLAVMLLTTFPIGPANRVAAQDGAPFDPAAFTLGLEVVVEGLERPVQFVDANDGSGRFFVVEQVGTIRILRDGELAAEPFLDIADLVSRGSEQGLLSMALHPEFSENGVFFIDYTDTDGDTQIERWTTLAGDPDRADPDSVETLLTVDQPYPNHNGGLLLFGPDGYLYVGLGDGGSGGDPEGHAQDLSTLLGSILRIDVNAPDGDLPYGIPEENPLVGEEDARPEIWVWGLRNPWRFSFDRETGDLYIGDVGQGSYEEISIFPAGSDRRNFGWDIMEGPECYAEPSCDGSGLEMPIFAYTQEVGGCSVIGGYVYRGEAVPALRGVYLLADYCSGLLWGVGRGDNGEWLASAPMETGTRISSFGEDAAGELYVVDLGGAVSKVVGERSPES